MRPVGVVLLALALLAPAGEAAVLARPPAKSLAPAVPDARALLALRSHPYSLLELDRAQSGPLAPILRRAGGRLISPSLAVWRVPSRAAARLAVGLEVRGALLAAEPDLPVRTFGHLDAGDPLLPQEWWLHVVGADRVEPPGPGVPVVIVDAGVDLTHPEFASRPETIALDEQRIEGADDVHGTAVASVAAAPANGIGLVGVYPQARLETYDFYGADVSNVIAGLEQAADGKPAVINFSGGFFTRSALLTRVVDHAVGRGAVIVASVGNDRENGSRRAVPAGLPHVLTIGATNQQDHVTFFSSRSTALDLAAPGLDIPVAVPTFFDPSGYAVFDGTSFSAPIVTGATAWVWTARPELDNTQVTELIRRSARDIGKRGWDVDTGFGVLDIPAALTRQAPAPDPLEPNEDVYVVKPGSLFKAGVSPLTQPGRLGETIRARLDRSEDPEDVYRVWVPRGDRFTVTVRPAANVDLAVWGPNTRTVYEGPAGQRRDLLAVSRHAGRATERIRLGRRSAGAYLYVDVFLGRKDPRTAYSLSVSSAPG